MTTAFETVLDGEAVKFETQCALGQLQIGRQASELLPLLASCGSTHNEAYALAYNCALLSQVLRGEHACETARVVLRRFTLAEIAGLARVYFEHGDHTFDDDSWGDDCEYGVNESYDAEVSHV